jgi:hypothetical protein
MLITAAVAVGAAVIFTVIVGFVAPKKGAREQHGGAAGSSEAVVAMGDGSTEAEMRERERKERRRLRKKKAAAAAAAAAAASPSPSAVHSIHVSSDPHQYHTALEEVPLDDHGDGSSRSSRHHQYEDDLELELNDDDASQRQQAQGYGIIDPPSRSSRGSAAAASSAYAAVGKDHRHAHSHSHSHSHHLDVLDDADAHQPLEALDDEDEAALELEHGGATSPSAIADVAARNAISASLRSNSTVAASADSSPRAGPEGGLPLHSPIKATISRLAPPGDAPPEL